MARTGRRGIDRWTLVGLLLALGGAVRAGSLDPPGAPASTMKPLDQVEPRTAITALPITISAPGSYYLTQNLTASTGINITVSNVTIDLNGFALTGAATSGTGIRTSVSSLRNITIRNGT